MPESLFERMANAQRPMSPPSGEADPSAICACGDRRDQHDNGMGDCKLNGLGHGGAPACHSFRLASHAPE